MTKISRIIQRVTDSTTRDQRPVMIEIGPREITLWAKGGRGFKHSISYTALLEQLDRAAFPHRKIS